MGAYFSKCYAHKLRALTKAERSSLRSLRALLLLAAKLFAASCGSCGVPSILRLPARFHLRRLRSGIG